MMAAIILCHCALCVSVEAYDCLVVEAIYTACVGTRGQITVPAKLREELDLRPGDLASFIANERGEIVFKPVNDRRKAGSL
jgi:AbrB family looped-hinge helix DNA binding protein